jgi:hypothetical protein
MKQRGYGDEFMDMDVEGDPDWGAPPGEEPVASTVALDRGAGTLGFAGTVSKDSAQAAGLTTLSGDEFGGGPRMPMLLNTWDRAPEECEDNNFACVATVIDGGALALSRYLKTIVVQFVLELW